MKTAVITLHYVTNFGSLLQTYATQSILEKLGFEVEIIDFRPIGLSFRRAIFPKSASVVNKIIKLPFRVACNIYQYLMVDSFLKQYIHLSAERYNAYAELEKRPPRADFYISGSDQIWNTQNANPPEDLGAYYLAFVGGCPKIAYASSFGKTDFSPSEEKTITDWLRVYSAISVREDSAVQILNRLGLEGSCVVDPTLLLTPEEWKRFLGREKISKKYIFVYNLNRNKVLEQVAFALSNKTGWEIVNFADTFEFINGANNRLWNTPLDFLHYLSNASYVITDSFHGTAFSLNFSRQFICAPAPKYNSRLESILRQTNCMDRMIMTADEALRAAEQTIPYEMVQSRLTKMRDLSFAFLEEALKNE